ncbi:hypothetical protein [Streptomyces sp. NPDC058371]|uniref:hypothetical protein n=1 Tax=Streptomyces sp. NPDC058371 TaxID=3346463 RepID=UPI003662C451
MDSKLYTQPDRAAAPESPPAPSLRGTPCAVLRAVGPRAAVLDLDGEFGPRE